MIGPAYKLQHFGLLPLDQLNPETEMSNQIKEHMDVLCSKGGKVGKVDHVDGDRIKLTKNDSPDGLHHFIPTSIVASVDEKVHLSKTGDEVKAMWTTA